MFGVHKDRGVFEDIVLQEGHSQQACKLMQSQQRHAIDWCEERGALEGQKQQILQE